MSSDVFETTATKWGYSVAQQLYRFLFAQPDGRIFSISEISAFVGVERLRIAALLAPFVDAAILSDEDQLVCVHCDEPTAGKRTCDLCHKAENVKQQPGLYLVKQRVAYWARGKSSQAREKGNVMITATEAIKAARIQPWDSLKNEDYIKSVTTLSGADHDDVLARLQRYGICMIRFQGLSPSTERLLSLEQWIGEAATVQNDFNGKIKEITPKDGIAANTGDSRLELLPHVDGTQDDPLPPQFLVFEYQTTPSFGGASTFVDMSHVVLSLDESARERILIALAQKDAAVISKKGLTYTGALVKSVLGGFAVSIRLRFDDVLKINSKYEKEFNELKEAVLAAPQLTYNPQEGDLVVFDNWRLLHGRKEVGGRHIRFHARMWIRKGLPKLEGTYLFGVRGLSVGLLAGIQAANGD